MRRDDVTILIDRLKAIYGEKYRPYGTSETEDEGTGFRITDIAATFSVVCVGDTPVGKYDVQIESYPPGDYLYTDELDLDSLLQLVEVFRRPVDAWPVNSR